MRGAPAQLGARGVVEDDDLQQRVPHPDLPQPLRQQHTACRPLAVTASRSDCAVAAGGNQSGQQMQADTRCRQVFLAAMVTHLAEHSGRTYDEGGAEAPAAVEARQKRHKLYGLRTITRMHVIRATPPSAGGPGPTDLCGGSLCNFPS